MCHISIVAHKNDFLDRFFGEQHLILNSTKSHPFGFSIPYRFIFPHFFQGKELFHLEENQYFSSIASVGVWRVVITTLKLEPKCREPLRGNPPSWTESVVPATYRTRVPSGALRQARTWASWYPIVAHKNRTRQVLFLPCFRPRERDLQGRPALASVCRELEWTGQPKPLLGRVLPG